MQKYFLFALVAFSSLSVTSVIADEVDHHGHWDVTCSTRNARGQRFTAEGYSDFQRDYHVWRDVQEEATFDCRTSGSLVCVELGCRERFHHTH